MFQLVPYSGNSPRRSRPIIIECDEKSLRFASEEIALAPRDLTGLTNDYNPLRAGNRGPACVLGCTTAFRESDLAAAEAVPVFVIRPGGNCLVLHCSRNAREDSMRVGYEWFPHRRNWSGPTTTPEAKEACQTAIDEVLGARRRLMAQVPEGPLPITGALQFEGSQGEFVFHEVEQLRRPKSHTFSWRRTDQP